jgi:hypothetical protein
MDWLEAIFEEYESKDEIIEKIKEAISNIYVVKEDAEKSSSEEVEKLKKEISDIKNEYAIEKEILSQGGKNPKAVRALIDETMIKYDEEGNIISIDMEEIKKSDPYLFKEIKNVVEGAEESKMTAKKSDKNLFFESARKAAGIKSR